MKKDSNKFPKVNLGRNLLKMDKDSNKDAQEILKLAMKILG